jgi:hypothetical protein
LKRTWRDGATNRAKRENSTDSSDAILTHCGSFLLAVGNSTSDRIDDAWPVSGRDSHYAHICLGL